VTRRRLWQVVGTAAIVGLSAWAVTIGVDRLARPEPEPEEPPPAPPAPMTAHITATLYYGSLDGRTLVPVRREVPFAEGVMAQGREVLLRQLEEAPEGYLQVVPTGTTLRGFYVTARGDAFVDLSPDVSTAHPGGSLSELLTVYALVNVVTTNLPSTRRVQILVDGKEADTIAGHVDVRDALLPDASLIREQ
jgi:hypothetical protein